MTDTISPLRRPDTISYRMQFFTTLFAKGCLTLKEASLVVPGAVKSLDGIKPTPSPGEMVLQRKL